jgi:uncharacterized coiled-coil DUF342 family protein
LDENRDKSPEIEIAELRGELSNIQERIVENIQKIDETKTKLNTEYRHRDREKYEAERMEITKDLLQYEIDMKTIKDKIREMES